MDRQYYADGMIYLLYDEQGVGPHEATVRAEYTVPAGRIATIESADVWVARTEAPTEAHAAQCDVVLKEAAEPAPIIILHAAVYSEHPADRASARLALPFTLGAGDKIYIRSLDNSKGGQVDYLASMLIREYQIQRNINSRWRMGYAES